MSDHPDLSIIVPCYNRAELLAYSLESVRRARGALAIEVIVVDDGSTAPVDPLLEPIRAVGARIVRQANQGLLFARLRGLGECSGRYVLFLDSDDLVSVGKLEAQVEAMDRSGAVVSYSDTAHCILEGEYDGLAITPDPAPVATTDLAEFLITVQPAPHSPIWRSEFIRTVAERPRFAPSPLYNCVAEIWFYHNAAVCTGRAEYVPNHHAIVGSHPGARLTNHWENLAVASLAVMEAFARSCPPGTPESDHARQLVAEKAFASWRRLPREFSPEFAARLLGVWRRLARDRSATRLGGMAFRSVAAILGPVGAARLFHRIQAGPYRACQTLTREEFDALMQAIPPA